MRIVFLTTDTKHHRYCVNSLATRGEVAVVHETTHPSYARLYVRWIAKQRTLASIIDNPYLRVGLAAFNREQEAFEDRFFDQGVPYAYAPGVRVHEFASVNRPECVETVKALRPDLLVSFGTGLIKKDILKIPCLKINVHRGILPRYRGLDSDLWAIYHEDYGHIGTTLHELQPRLDTGAVIAQKTLPLRKGMKLPHLRYYTTLLAVEMLTDVVETMQRGEKPRATNQDLAQGRYFSYMPPLIRLKTQKKFVRHMLSFAGPDA